MGSNKRIGKEPTHKPAAQADDRWGSRASLSKVGMGSSASGPESWQHQKDFSDILFDATMETVFLFDPTTGKPLRWNKHFADVSGYTDEDISHLKAPDDFYTEADIARAKKVMATALAEGSGKMVMSLVTKHGALIPFEYAATAINTADGRSLLLSIGRDLSEHKQAEEDLRKANDYLQTLALSSPLAIIALDIDGMVTMWNPAAERIFGWSRKEILGRPLPSVPDDLREEYVSSIAKVLRGEILRNAEFRRKTKTGETVFVNASLAPLRGPNNEVIGVVSMIGDVTERKALDYRLRQAQKLEVLGRLSAGLAHEFKNMLMGISGYAEVLQLKFKPDDPDFESINDLLSCVDKAAKLTNQIQTFGKPKPIESAPVVINHLVKELEHMLKKLLGESIQLALNLTTDNCVISADRSQIEQVLVNLAINARDAMPAGGTFTIRTRLRTIHEYDIQGRTLVPGDYIVIRISDTGVGMDEETRDHVFEPFFTTKRKGDRTGLGLALVYSTINQHKGYIEVSSKPGEGTVFRILLPCIQVSAEDIEIPADTPPKQGAGTILLVEDEGSVRTPCKMMLEGFGYSVICAANGEEAMDLYQSKSDDIDLVVMDLIMPKVSGKQALEAMQKIRPDAKVLFMSGHVVDSVHKDVAPPPGTPFLMKPFPLRKLVETVNELLGFGSGSEDKRE